MMSFIGKLLPIHGYQSILTKDLPQNYDISLSHLYQPLVGMKAMMLYQTLLNENRIFGEQTIRTHHALMNYLNISLETIYNERLKLEAIGLLKTFESIKDSQKVYTYDLQCPFTPRQFFNDPMLSELLFHHLGEKMFTTLKKQLIQKQHLLADRKEITAKFSDIFTTVKPTLPIDESSSELKFNADQDQAVKEQFSMIATSLKQRLIPPEKVLTPGNNRLISDMMHLYHLTEIDIEKCVLWALREDHTLDHDEFKAACQDIFKTEKNALIQLQPKAKSTASAKKRTSDVPKQNQSPKEQLCELLETISMRQLLEGFTAGEASEKDLQMIGDIMQTHRLEAGVMNVLVHYVLTQSNRKLSRGYLEAIASHWARLSLKTAREAMDFVEAEIEKARSRKSRRKSYQRKQQEVIPDWFKEQKEARKQSTKDKAKKDKVKSYNEAEILALFHKHSSENKKKQG